LRTFAARDVDRVLVVWIEFDELAALHPFFPQKFELPLDIAWMKRFIRLRSTPIVLNALFWRCGPYSMPRRNQPVPPHLARAFQMRGARVAATECTDRAPQALLVACIAEVVSTLRIRRDSGVILIGR
jgi:hypothetical protein